MVRPADGVDLGLWAKVGVPTSVLLCPVDTHIHKLSLNLGLTRRRDLSWATAEEITKGLARLDPDDPVKYDFSLCHLGMLQRCPSRRDPARCEGCGVMPVCRHWTRGVRARRRNERA
jgi:endonuclease III